MKNLVKTYPLKSISISEATKWQFKIVQKITENIDGFTQLTRGDLGVKQPRNMPDTTYKVERAIAAIFGVDDAVLVTGSGTGAIRSGIQEFKCEKVLVHDAPVYPTTKISLDFSGVQVIKSNFNDTKALKKTINENPEIELAIVQYSRQKIDDSYSFKKVIRSIKRTNNKVRILTDDNYAVFKTGNVGTDFGADISTFSAFKLQGPEGVGIVIGKKGPIESIRSRNYSGGSQVQGWQALEVLRGFVYSPLLFAIQAEQCKKVEKQIKTSKINKVIDYALVINAQSKVLVIKFKKSIAGKILKVAPKFGALPHPVGAESKYEITPLFYRVSSAFREVDPTSKNTMIRINPNRASANTVLYILEKCIREINAYNRTNKKK